MEEPQEIPQEHVESKLEEQEEVVDGRVSIVPEEKEEARQEEGDYYEQEQFEEDNVDAPLSEEYISSRNNSFQQHPVSSSSASIIPLSDTPSEFYAASSASPSRRSRASQSGAITPFSEAATVPSILEFESWWFENGIQRVMQICFFSESCVFEVKIDDSIVPLNIAVFDKEGRSLEAWDLFVGAVIDVLGKPTTLRKATLPTIDWLDKQARKIFREKLRLEKELEKFGVHKLHVQTKSIEGPTARPLYVLGKENVIGGTVCLRRLFNCIEFLRKELSKFKRV